MMRRLIPLAAATLLAAALVAVPMSAETTIKAKCQDSGQPVFATADPIVNHNEIGAGHEHQFFGSTAWLGRLVNPNTANYADLVIGPTNCRIPADTAGYWTPTLLRSDGSRVPVQQFTAYYRSFDHRDIGEARAFPKDTRLVSAPGRYNWTCGQNSGAQATPVPYFPNCTGLSGGPGETLTAHIDFPSCWDGVLPTHTAEEVGDTRDNAHYAYTVGRRCPAGYPVKMVELRETIQFAYTGDGTDVALSSGGSALHGDFFNSWNQTAFEALIRNCINPGGTRRGCG